jgi:hypothetical protein
MMPLGRDYGSYVTKQVAVNEAGHPRLEPQRRLEGFGDEGRERAAVRSRHGQVRCRQAHAKRARSRHRLSGEDARERITFYPETKVVFVRESGNVDGFIVNEALGEEADLRLRCSWLMRPSTAPRSANCARSWNANT